MNFGLVRGFPWKRLILVPARPISASAVPFGPGIDIWRSCRFYWCSYEVSLLPSWGLARFVPCSIGANHAGFVLLGGRSVVMVLLLGLVKAPLCWNFSFFFVWAGRALLAGTLLLRYCFDRFACRSPTWRLPASGGVGDLLAASLAVRHEVVSAVGRREVFRVRNSGLPRKRIRPDRKPPAHLAGLGDQSRPRVWKKLRPVDLFGDSFPGHRRRRGAQDYERFILSQVRTGVG